jgi:hypothetical protein
MRNGLKQLFSICRLNTSDRNSAVPRSSICSCEIQGRDTAHNDLHERGMHMYGHLNGSVFSVSSRMDSWKYSDVRFAYL